MRPRAAPGVVPGHWPVHHLPYLDQATRWGASVSDAGSGARREADLPDDDLVGAHAQPGDVYLSAWL